MDDDTLNQTAEQNAVPEQSPVSEDVNVVADVPAEDKPAEKAFTQAELDAAIGKRLAKEQRKWNREQQTRLAELQQQARSRGDLSIDQFDDAESYAQALAERKAEELIARKAEEKKRSEISESFYEKEEEARARYDDYDDVVQNPNLTITQVMAEAIRESDIGTEVAYYLGSNPKEAARIAKLSAFAQAKEIGKLEVKLTDNPPAKKVTSAPPPINRVTPKAASVASYSTTDPRSAQSMSTSEWIAAERRRQIEKMKAR